MNSLIIKSRSIFRVFKISFLFLIFYSFSYAGPKNTNNYDIHQGQLTDINDGAYVEGSERHGGIQPDYFIDLNQEPLKSILFTAEKIGRSNESFWNKIGQITELIRNDVFKYNDYANPYYRRLLKRHRDTNTDISLNEYANCKAGVCREHALILHFALKAAGIENFHAYADIYRASKFNNFEIREDHAFTVVTHNKVKWVVDAYYWGFNGFKLSDLLSSNGITENSIHAPIANPGPGFRRIIKINSFPTIYNPKKNKLKCSTLF